MFRVYRHLSLDVNCCRCGIFQEDILHLLRDSQKTKWSYLNWPGSNASHQNNSKDCIQNNIKGDKGILFSITCWFIWRSRNEEIFNDKVQPVWHIANQIHTLNDIIYKDVTQSLQQPSPMLVLWIAPPGNVMKLNTDGSAFGNLGQAGFGGIIRDNLGNWHTGFMGSCGFTTSVHAELLAIYHGLKIARDIGIGRLICESDLKVALDLITGEINMFHQYFPTIMLIHSLKHMDWEVTFVHVYREGNKCADWFAKTGNSSQQGMIILDHRPSPIYQAYLG
ncbi:putative ribonuclease H protein [Glycine soja]